ncbi:MAG: hypothetical protein FWE61_07820, partial [Micrococcales bacterium]|nr:hypothetical protein [Micrococcales bacterium]
PLVFGVVESVRTTGLEVNNQPQLELTMQFTTLDGQPVTASLRKVVSHANLAQLGPGAQLAIRYNPEKPSEIMLETNADQAMLQEALNAQRLARGEVTQEQLDIATYGVKAQGVVLASQPTGNVVRGCGEMFLRIRVTGPSSDAFDTTVTKAVPQHALHLAQPGAVLTVFYLPHNPMNIVVAFPAG